MTTATATLDNPPGWKRILPAGYLVALIVVVGINFLSRNGHDEQRIHEIALLLATGLVLVLARSAALMEFFCASWGGRALALFFACGAASTTMAYAPGYARVEVALFLLLLAIALAIAEQVQRGGIPLMRMALQALGCAAVLHAVRIVVNYCASFALGTQLEPLDFAPGFSNHRFFNHTQTALLPLLVLLYCLTPRASRLRYLWLALVSLWWLSIFATTGRGTVMGLAAGVIIAVVVLRRSAVPYLKTFALTVAGGIAMYVVFLVIIPVIAGHGSFGAFEFALERSRNDPSSMRFFVWTNALELGRQHPWFGVGPMHFAHDAARFRWAAHPHDWVLQIAAEWGLPALLLLGFALFRGMRALVRSRAGMASIESGNVVLPALLVSGAAVLVDGLVSGLIVMPQSQLAIAMYLGFAIAWVRMSSPAEQPPRAAGGAMRLANVVVLSAALASLVAGTYADIVDVMHDGTPNAAANRGLRWPRLWEQGFF
ncbi:O-antigen ligase family protein [Massilia sp. TW-1]|uniref:O-antigen ligase family protein n=1 Tax=Telluria antibiotica TaxID=2717319 RepID=A0ABX0PDX2_9BURK|nr:O-antigen ligase family protein [Telluria antibiotica]NIA55567.1 O-antigen ligase family protein [Telluria antibiotica]